MFLFGILLARQVVPGLKNIVQSFLKFHFFDISHCIESCQVSMYHCAKYTEFSSGSSKQINSLPTHLKALIPCTAQQI